MEIITFGCRLNLYESEAMRVLAREAGLSDAVIFNSCAVTGEAERQVGQAIRRKRRERPDAVLVVTGCAAQINPEKYAVLPEVNFVLGNEAKMKAEVWGEIGQKQRKENGTPAFAGVTVSFEGGLSTTNDVMPATCRAEAAKQRRGKAGISFGLDGKIITSDIAQAKEASSPLVRGFAGGLTRGFVQVQNGCDHACTYCIIPQGRGRSRSVPLETITAQTRLLLEKGYPEIALTGVDITSYGSDLLGQPSLGLMVKRLLMQVPELRRLRLSSLDPMEIDEDLWKLIESEPRLMPQLHLSLQSGDDMVLKRMKRRHTRKDIERLVLRARAARPDMVFGADAIAGFPTETDAMFENTYRFLEELDFTWLHVFPYSARKGTPAARMPQVPMAVRKARAARLRELGEKAVHRHIDGLVGQKIEVHVEQPFLARTPSFAEVVLLSPEEVGSVVQVEGLRREGERLIAQRVKRA